MEEAIKIKLEKLLNNVLKNPFKKTKNKIKGQT